LCCLWFRKSLCFYDHKCDCSHHRHHKYIFDHPVIVIGIISDRRRVPLRRKGEIHPQESLPAIAELCRAERAAIAASAVAAPDGDSDADFPELAVAAIAAARRAEAAEAAFDAAAAAHTAAADRAAGPVAVAWAEALRAGPDLSGPAGGWWVAEVLLRTREAFFRDVAARGDVGSSSGEGAGGGCGGGGVAGGGSGSSGGGSNSKVWPAIDYSVAPSASPATPAVAELGRRLREAASLDAAEEIGKMAARAGAAAAAAAANCAAGAEGGASALHKACAHGRGGDAVRRLLELGADHAQVREWASDFDRWSS
jgi:hypothetical protein